MAIIKNLSLTTGGGIISSASQCEQVDNVVSLFIGLGGTGTDAIRSIKTRVYERLIPDNVDDLNNCRSSVSVPEYKHIKFYSFDSDTKSNTAGNRGYIALENYERKDLSLSGGMGAVDPVHRPDLKWLIDNSDFRKVIELGEGAGGIRQAGRYLLFDKIVEIESKIDTLINQAREGLYGDYRVVVHIFAGLSGGTGSGTFLDMCYIIRKVLEDRQYNNSYILGYFFLPDVSMSQPGIDGSTKEFIKKNGYAALQELNYCMGLQNNGGEFRQVISDGSHIVWKTPPVNVCHLIGAETQKKANYTGDSYNYAMRTVTEYVMDFVIKNPKDPFDVYQVASNGWSRTLEGTTDRTGGYNPCVVSIGAACASIPYREINTFLACSIFEEYRKTHEESVNQFAAEEVILRAWNASSDETAETLVKKIYSSLLQKLSGNDIDGLQGYDYYQDPDGSRKPWNYLLDTVQSNGDNNLEAVYQSALEDHIGILAANAAKLINQGVEGAVNTESLLYQLDKQLDPIVKDINRGPQYAKNIIDNVEGINVLSLIAGLRAENDLKNEKAKSERAACYHDYQETKRIFFNRESQKLFEGDKERFVDFENCVIAYVHSIELAGGKYSNSPNAKEFKGVYGYISDVLDALEKQIRDRVANYYSPLCSTLDDLTETFEQNYKILTNGSNAKKDADFENSLVSIYDPHMIEVLKKGTDEISKGDKFRELMSSLIEAGYEVWQKRDERLPKAIQNFFVAPPDPTNDKPGGLFYAYAEKSIDEFLEIKYNGVTGKALEDKLAEDFFGKMMDASLPLLTLDSSKFNMQAEYRRKVTYPEESSVLTNALRGEKANIDQHGDQGWKLVSSPIKDKLLFVQIRDQFPMQASVVCGELENTVTRSSPRVGSHLYEADGIYDDMEFSNWRNLPAITAPSFMDDNVSDEIKTRVDHVRELFDKAVECGVIKINSPYDAINEDPYSYIYGVPDALKEEIDGLVDAINRATKASELESIKRRVNELLDGGYKELSQTDIKLKQPVCRHDVDEYDANLKFDYLYLSPIYQIRVREILDQQDNCLEALRKVAEVIRQRDESFSKEEANYKKNYFLALYTGVLKIIDDDSSEDNGAIIYEQDDNGLIITHRLFEFGKSMEYEEVPFYQAYLSYLDLDPTVKDSIYTLASKKRASSAAKQYARELKESKLSDGEINDYRTKARNNQYKPLETIERFLVDLKNFVF